MSPVPVLLAAGAVLVQLAAAGSTSKDQVTELVKRMTERQITSIAAPVPNGDGRYAAALLIPNAQLLVIGTRYPVPAALDERIRAGDFQQAYSDLQGAGDRDGRIFVIDSGANGLVMLPDDNQPFDIVWRDAKEQANYDANWKAQKLSEAAYKQRFEKDEKEYAELLAALIAGASQPATPQ
jgi:hypothetical protein